jgi:hypothetical protein
VWSALVVWWCLDDAMMPTMPMTPTPTYRLVTAEPPESALPAALALGDEVLPVDMEEVAIACARVLKRVLRKWKTRSVALPFDKGHG